MGKGGHGGGMAGGGHSHSTEFPEDTWNLYQHIDRCEALNATVPGDAAGIFKPFTRRLDEEPCLVSDSDEELLIKVSFTSPVHIRKIMVIGGGEGTDAHPSGMRVFVDCEELDFSSASEGAPTQEFELAPNVEGEGWVTTRQGPFTLVTSVAFYFTGNVGDVDASMVKYIGMQGDHTHDKRRAVEATYEVLGTPHDLTAQAEQGGVSEGM